MGSFGNRFQHFITRYSPTKPFTEATATVALSRWLYRGHGEKYLSLPICEDGIGRPADARPRRFRCPSTKQDYARWLPLREHMLGDQKGIVSDAQTTSVPFVAVDIDRHSGTVKAEDHQRVVIEAGRYLCRSVPHVKWMVEINPRNGSTKFFGFRRSGDVFTKFEFEKLSSKIRQDLIQRGLCHGNNVEVFPNNCHAVWLPLRRDKITIVDNGMLARCTRKTRNYRFFPERVLEPIRCYSATSFMEWIRRGENYDEATLVSALRFACAGLPDEVVEVPSSPGCTGIAPSPAARELDDPVPAKPVKASTKFDAEEPNAFRRNWSALLPYSRDFFRSNGRLPSANEALRYLKDNGLFSGSWEDNKANRRHRVHAILKKIKESFDPSLLQSNGHVELDQDVARWCRHRFPNGLIARRRMIDQMKMACRIKVFRIPARFVHHCVGVIAFCLNDRLENDALPVNRIKAIWSLVPYAPSWNQEYFTIVRKHLEDIGVIDIFDKNHQVGKAWRWKKGPNFPRGKKRGTGRAGVSRRPSTAGVRERGREGVKEERVYNTLYQTADQNSRLAAILGHVRPPPGRAGPQSAVFHLQLRLEHRFPIGKDREGSDIWRFTPVWRRFSRAE